MSHVFISYVREDQEVVDRLCDELHNHGVAVWLDRDKIYPGQRWKHAIREAIREGAFFLACFSGTSTTRSASYMNEELALAIDQLRQRPVEHTWFIPIRLSDCNIPDRGIGGGETLWDLQWVDLFKNWNSGIIKILRVVQAGSDHVTPRKMSARQMITDQKLIQGALTTVPLQITSELELVRFLTKPKERSESAPSTLWPRPKLRNEQRYHNPLYAVGFEATRIHPISVQHLRSDRKSSAVPLELARPAKKICFYGEDRRLLNVAVLVLGDMVPGINALIDAIVQQHWKYAEASGHQKGLKIFGMENGFNAFLDYPSSYFLLTPHRQGLERELVTPEYANQGGSILGLSPVDALKDSQEGAKILTKIAQVLHNELIDILYIIGGDGGMKAAHALWDRSSQEEGKLLLTVIGIPKSVCNNVLWVSPSLGSLTVAAEAAMVLETVGSEIRSYPRIAIVQLPGLGSGFMVCQAVNLLSKGTCDAVLIPESPYSIKKVANYLVKRISERENANASALIVIAEGTIPADIATYISQCGCKPEEEEAAREFEMMRTNNVTITSQIVDILRGVGVMVLLKGLHTELQSAFSNRHDIRVFLTEPRHILRAIGPREEDIELAKSLGKLAVDTAMAGYTDVMVANWNDNIFVVPLELVLYGARQLSTTGALYKSVMKKTGQPSCLT